MIPTTHRRVGAVGLALAAAVGLTTACSSGSGPSGASTAGGVTTLKLWTHNGGNTAELGVDKRVGLANRMWAEQVLRFRAALPDTEQTLAGAVLRNLRMRKTPAEVAAVETTGPAVFLTDTQQAAVLHAGTSILADDAQSFGVMLEDGHPERYQERISISDARWLEIRDNPLGRIPYILVSLGKADLILLRWPTLSTLGPRPFFVRRLLYANPDYALFSVKGLFPRAEGG